MVCNSTAFSGGRLGGITVQGKPPPRKRRRVARRRVDKSAIKLQREAERSKFIDSNPSFSIVGKQLVCPDSVISQICSNAKYISVLDDMDLFFLRHELKEPFFRVVVNLSHT